MIFGGADLEYDNFELLLGQDPVIKVTYMSKTAFYHVILTTKQLN